MIILTQLFGGDMCRKAPPPPPPPRLFKGKSWIRPCHDELLLAIVNVMFCKDENTCTNYFKLARSAHSQHTCENISSSSVFLLILFYYVILFYIVHLSLSWMQRCVPAFFLGGGGYGPNFLFFLQPNIVEIRFVHLFVLLRCRYCR